MLRPETPSCQRPDFSRWHLDIIFKEVPKQLVKRLSAIEPVIAHAKQDHALERDFLKEGSTGDHISALLVACSFNLRKLIRLSFKILSLGLIRMFHRDDG